MRRVMLGLLGTALAGQAWAGECRAGHMRLVSGKRVLQVERTSYAEIRDGTVEASRALLQGRLAGKAYTVDVRTVQGSNPDISVYRGDAPASSFPSGWGRSPRISAGSSFRVYGALPGEWTLICKAQLRRPG